MNEIKRFTPDYILSFKDKNIDCDDEFISVLIQMNSLLSKEKKKEQNKFLKKMNQEVITDEEILNKLLNKITESQIMKIVTKISKLHHPSKEDFKKFVKNWYTKIIDDRPYINYNVICFKKVFLMTNWNFKVWGQTDNIWSLMLKNSYECFTKETNFEKKKNNIIFLGHLFLQNIIAIKTLVNIIKILLKNNEIELICTLIQTLQDKVILIPNIQNLKLTAENKRMQFMIDDTNRQIRNIFKALNDEDEFEDKLEILFEEYKKSGKYADILFFVKKCKFIKSLCNKFLELYIDNYKNKHKFNNILKILISRKIINKEILSICFNEYISYMDDLKLDIPNVEYILKGFIKDNKQYLDFRRIRNWNQITPTPHNSETMLAAKRKGLGSFKYKGKTYKGRKHARLGMIYKRAK